MTDDGDDADRGAATGVTSFAFADARLEIESAEERSRDETSFLRDAPGPPSPCACCLVPALPLALPLALPSTFTLKFAPSRRSASLRSTSRLDGALEDDCGGVAHTAGMGFCSVLRQAAREHGDE